MSTSFSKSRQDEFIMIDDDDAKYIQSKHKDKERERQKEKEREREREKERQKMKEVREKEKYPLPGVAQRILNKKRLPGGQIKYLVKWVGYSEDDATWESEEAMRAKYSDLLQDYEFFALTGERLEQDVEKEKEPKKRAIKGAGRTMESYQRESAERKRPDNQVQDIKGNRKETTEDKSLQDKNNKKIKEKEKKMFDSQNEEITQQIQGEISELTKKHFKQIQSIQSQFNLPLVQNQFQIKFQRNLISKSTDQISCVQLLKIDDGQTIFKIIWKKRSDETQPLPEFYPYEFLSKFCPQLSIKIFENMVGIQNDLLGIDLSNIQLSAQLLPLRYDPSTYQSRKNDEKQNNKVFQIVPEINLTKYQKQEEQILLEHTLIEESIGQEQTNIQDQNKDQEIQISLGKEQNNQEPQLQLQENPIEASEIDQNNQQQQLSVQDIIQKDQNIPGNQSTVKELNIQLLPENEQQLSVQVLSIQETGNQQISPQEPQVEQKQILSSPENQSQEIQLKNVVTENNPENQENSQANIIQNQQHGQGEAIEQVQTQL